MILRNTMKDTLLVLLIFSSLFLFTRALFCSTNCSNIPIEGRHACLNTTASICKGQIIAYYYGRSYPKSINYTFGTIDDPTEGENEDYVNIYGLEQFQKYQLIINDVKREEATIKADIYCTTKDDCAWEELRRLSEKYRHQINPFVELKQYIYLEPSPKTLSCYDPSIRDSKQCHVVDVNPVCISNTKDLKQECSTESEIYLSEEYLITVPYTVQLDLTYELVRCNRDHCNNNQMLAKIKNISADYAYGTLLRETNAAGLLNRQSDVFMLALFEYFLLLIKLV